MSLPLASSTWDQKELMAIQSVIDKDRYTMGDAVKQFENNFANYIGSKYCVMVNSGSSANLLAIASLFFKKEKPFQKGLSVIVPAVSWSTTYSPLQQYGLVPVFVDIDLETLNFNLEELKKAVNKYNPAAILAVNLLGNPNNFQEIRDIIKGKDIVLLEDNCESMGATFRGKFTGTFGLMGTFSTFFSHHISTMEGGMVVTDDEELYHILLSLRSHGWTRHLPKTNLLCEKKDNPFEESFRFLVPGYNLRPLEMSGAIGIEQLKKLPKFIEVRRGNAKTFQMLFKDHSDFFIQREVGSSSWFGFSLIIKPESSLTREQVIQILQNNKVDCRPIVAGDFTQSEVFKYFNGEISGPLSNAKYLNNNGLFIGNHHIDIKKELESVAKLFDKVKYEN